LNEQALSPLVVFLSNDELRELSIIETHQGDWQNHVITEIMRSFIFRDMEKAQRMVKECKHIQRHALMFYHVIMDFYVGLTCCYFARQTGDITQLAEVQQICDNFDGWVSQQNQKVQHIIPTLTHTSPSLCSHQSSHHPRHRLTLSPSLYVFIRSFIQNGTSKIRAVFSKPNTITRRGK
jgi:hypothetical protein